MVSLANTAEPLYLVNRGGNRPSHQHADIYLDRAIALCRRGGFRRVTNRGDTKFTQTRHLDRWDRHDVRFIFGMDVRDNLKDLAERLDDLKYSELERPPRYTIKIVPRQARLRHKERVVAERQFATLKLIGEEVAEFEHRPVACERAYQVVVLRKRLAVEKGQLWLFEPDRYFFYLTDDRTT
ncbi:MAG: IS1380 family transposase, partial [Planctomycetaceae bacterium]|nr:IS1380 family transposase [Planctomycetaceae bacterium]